MNEMPTKNLILIYQFSNAGNFAKNPLSEFLSFLRFAGKKGNICFSHAKGRDSLHATLSIKENLMLDAVANGLSKQHEDNFFAKLNQMSNTSLLEMIHGLGDSVRSVHQLAQDELEMLAIAKALLSDTEYVVLDINENYLKNTQTELIQKAILFEANNNKRIFLIQTKDPSAWPELVTNYIERHGPYGFTINDSHLYQSSNVVKLERSNPPENVYHFSLKKSA